MKRIAKEDRKSLIRIAWGLSKGSEERLTLLKLASYDWSDSGLDDEDYEDLQAAILKNLKASKPSQLKEVEIHDLPDDAYSDIKAGKNLGDWGEGDAYAGKFKGRSYVLFDGRSGYGPDQSWLLTR
jgi:hypothetical protein